MAGIRDSHSSPSPHHLTGPDADTGAADKAGWPPRGAQPLGQPGDPSPVPGESPAAPAFQVPEPGCRSHFLTALPGGPPYLPADAAAASLTSGRASVPRGCGTWTDTAVLQCSAYADAAGSGGQGQPGPPLAFCARRRSLRASALKSAWPLTACAPS